ncbi:MAG TPA: polysaccharide pyruvyl transferase family protein [Acidimicrobiales bacterium]|nr:polysaccharide pyruvyl transferase family protein [Acidimicrobiales bacterium]
MIGVLHAYSRANAGDGLLVDLTLDRLARAGVDRADVLLVALDPDSFADVPRRVGTGTRRRGLGWDLLPAVGRAAALTATSLADRPVGPLGRSLAGCRALVAVGGGYLRAADATSSAGTAVNHLPQLLAAAAGEAPSLYLPQSIGPLRGPVGAAVGRALRRVDTVCVRDPWSAAELAEPANVRRLPDLAVLELAEVVDGLEPVPPGGRVGFVARPVAHAPGYEAAMAAVADGLGSRAVWAVQTAGDRTKSDAVHYRRMGVDPRHRLTDLLAGRQLSAVASVRLHGALMAVRAGVPAVHLAYDRKGPAAFADLGLDDWCLDVRSLRSEELGAALAALTADPRPYWDRLRRRAGDLRAASAALDELVVATVAG